MHELHERNVSILHGSCQRDCNKALKASGPIAACQGWHEFHGRITAPQLSECLRNVNISLLCLQQSTIETHQKALLMHRYFSTLYLMNCFQDVFWFWIVSWIWLDPKLMKLRLRQQDMLFFPRSQHHGCWCTGTLGANAYPNMVLSPKPEYSVSSIIRVNWW